MFSQVNPHMSPQITSPQLCTETTSQAAPELPPKRQKTLRMGPPVAPKPNTPTLIPKRPPKKTPPMIPERFTRMDPKVGPKPTEMTSQLSMEVIPQTPTEMIKPMPAGMITQMPTGMTTQMPTEMTTQMPAVMNTQMPIKMLPQMTNRFDDDDEYHLPITPQMSRHMKEVKFEMTREEAIENIRASQVKRKSQNESSISNASQVMRKSQNESSVSSASQVMRKSQNESSISNASQEMRKSQNRTSISNELNEDVVKHKMDELSEYQASNGPDDEDYLLPVDSLYGTKDNLLKTETKDNQLKKKTSGNQRKTKSNNNATVRMLDDNGEFSITSHAGLLLTGGMHGDKRSVECALMLKSTEKLNVKESNNDEMGVNRYALVRGGEFDPTLADHHPNKANEDEVENKIFVERMHPTATLRQQQVDEFLNLKENELLKLTNDIINCKSDNWTLTGVVSKLKERLDEETLLSVAKEGRREKLKQDVHTIKKKMKKRNGIL